MYALAGIAMNNYTTAIHIDNNSLLYIRISISHTCRPSNVIPDNDGLLCFPINDQEQ